MSDATGLLNTHHGPTGESCIDYLIIPVHLKDSVLECHTYDYDTLNTSDHVPVSMKLDIGNIPRGAVEGAPQPKFRWDKLSPEMLYNRYQTPLEQSLRALISKWETIDCGDAGIDTMMRETIDTIKLHATQQTQNIFKIFLKGLKKNC